MHGDRHVAGNEFDWTCTGGHALSEFLARFAAAWPVNFCMAFWWQILVAGPAARMALRAARTYRSGRVPSAEEL